MNVTEARCPNCGKKLGENINVGARIKCARCGEVVLIDLKCSELILHTV